MAPYLEQLESSIDLGMDRKALHAELKEKNEAELKKLDAELEDAKTNMGETDLSDVLKRRALYLTRIGHREQAIEAYTAALEKVVGLGARIDQRLALIRIGLFHSDYALTIENISKTQELIDEGGDWDRRNRLKAYKGLHCLSIRDFQQGGELLLDTLSTFAATELMDYDSFVTVCIIAATLTLPRADYKKKIINAPEVLGILPSLPHLKEFSTSLYNGEYAKFFKALAEVETHYLAPSRLLSIHTRYYVREMRIKAYSQLLESYRSVTMTSLCSAFGVNEEWLDADLARFIAAGRLSVTIDKVNGVVETSRGDVRNARYEQVIKSGDSLLNNLQRVSRALSTTT